MAIDAGRFGAALGEPASMPTVAENKYWDRYAWPRDGDEWDDQAAACGVPYSVWKQSLVDAFIAVSEETCVLEVVHPADPAIDAKLDQIAKAYRQRYNQDAVMRIRTPAEQTFWRR